MTVGGRIDRDRDRRLDGDDVERGHESRLVRTAWWIPRAIRRSASMAASASSMVRASRDACLGVSLALGPVAGEVTGSYRTASRRCWAPSCRSRSSRFRSASPAATIRARDACSSRTSWRTAARQRLVRGGEADRGAQLAAEPIEGRRSPSGRRRRRPGPRARWASRRLREPRGRACRRGRRARRSLAGDEPEPQPGIARAPPQGADRSDPPPGRGDSR